MADQSFTDAIALLKADHRTVEDLFEQFQAAKAGNRKKTIARRICVELKIHTLLEEEIFYPAFRGKIEDDTLDEAYVEHDGAKTLIAELEAGSPEDEYYDAKVKVLSEEINHHVKEEEKPGGIFTQARKAGMDLDALGERLAARKKELMGRFEKRLPAPRTRTMKAPPLAQQSA